MAEIAVNLVIGKLIPLRRYEVTRLKEVHSQVASIKDQPGLIRAYLKDADVKAEKEEKSDVVKEWVKRVREVAHRIEDGIALEIHNINEAIATLDKRKETLGFVPSDAESSYGGAKASSSGGMGHDLRRGSLFLHDAKLVGINDTTTKLKSLLLDEDRRRKVIAAVGTGGLGTDDFSWA